MQFDTAMTDELLATTRAVRKRLDLDRPVARDTILECLDLAVQAPTGSNKQEWQWVVVENPDVKAEIGRIYKRAADHYFNTQGAEALAAQDATVAKILSSSSWLAESIERVPALVIPCIHGRPQANWPAFKVAAHFGSIFPAVWSFQLALRSRGLGSTITTLHLNEEAKAADLLGIPANMMQVALLPVAYTKGTDFKRANRTPAAELTHWNAW